MVGSPGTAQNSEFATKTAANRLSPAPESREAAPAILQPEPRNVGEINRDGTAWRGSRTGSAHARAAFTAAGRGMVAKPASSASTGRWVDSVSAELAL
jgi:hypothetical protein